MLYSYLADIRPDPDGGYLVTFPDVPEAITAGADIVEAKHNAVEALGLALRGYLVEGRHLPPPAARGKHLVPIPLEAGTALKIAVIEAFRTAGISKSELARRVGKAETEAHRILDPDHATKLASLEMALAALGKQVVISIQDAA
jgi:antitoxin HicB